VLVTLDERALPHPVVGIEQVKASESGLIRLGNDLNESNWIVWQLRMKTVLESYRALGYVTGVLECPDPYANSSRSRRNWGKRSGRILYPESHSPVFVSESVESAA